MQIKIFSSREEVRAFWQNLSYDECWEAMDGYGELDLVREEWDREIASGACKEAATACLRAMGETEFLDRHPIKTDKQIQFEQEWGCTWEEGARRFREDPFWQLRIERERGII